MKLCMITNIILCVISYLKELKTPNMVPAGLQKSYGRPHSFSILSAFLYDF